MRILVERVNCPITVSERELRLGAKKKKKIMVINKPLLYAPGLEVETQRGTFKSYLYRNRTCDLRIAVCVNSYDCTYNWLAVSQ